MNPISTPACGNLAAVRALLEDHGIVVNKRTILNWSKGGTFPAPIRLSARYYVWNLDEVRAAILRRTEGCQ